jgi:hypothetical protein
MSGFLSNLLSRTRGTADLVRPRLASLFEPTAGTGVIGEWESEGVGFEEVPVHGDAARATPPEFGRPVTGAIDRPMSADVAAVSNSSPQEQRERAPTESLSPQRTTLPQVRTSEGAHLRGLAEGAVIPATTRGRPSGPTTTLTRERAGEASDQEHRALGPESKRRDGTARTTVRPAGEADGSAGLLGSSAATSPLLNAPARTFRFEPTSVVSRASLAEPHVQITIGRIEVRAVSEQAPPRQSSSSSPVMSLAEYLESRTRE